MAVKVNFDTTHNVETPTLVLAKRSGDKLGAIPAVNIVYKETLTLGSELSFRVYKYDNGNENPIWSSITDFKLLYCPEWNQWFEISVEIDEGNETIKNVQAQSLGIAELSQIMLYGIEINTDTDIESEGFEKYGKTILYSENAEISMLNRILKDKGSHYQIGHIDSTLISETEKRLVQFTFDNKSLYDALQEISEELNALLYIDTSTVRNSTDRLGEISRTINMYDLETNCSNCGHRGDFKDECPNCGATGDYITEGYGEDTTIFVSIDNLSDDINFKTDNDSVKNCFKLEAGDDTMTDIIRSCNANGSSYIWYISDKLKEDMSGDLVSALQSYDDLYNDYQNTHNYTFSVSVYNTLVNKYKSKKTDLQNIPSVIQGYPSLMTGYYNTLDFYVYLQHQLMPSVETETTTAATELANAKAYVQQNGIAIRNYSSYTSDSTIESSIKSVIGALVSSNYKVTLSTGSTTFNSATTTGTWTGSITLSRYYESELDPPATVTEYTINLNNNDETYYKQLINKKISQTSGEQYGTANLLSLDTSDTDFKNALKNYGLQGLTEFATLCEAIINILIEQGVADRDRWNSITGAQNLYNKMYVPYCNRATWIENELSLRETELEYIQALQDDMDEQRLSTMRVLNFENYLKNISDDIWVELCSFRREDTYSNSNYISDGLNNAELFNQAINFIDIAKKEIFKSATLQHSISSSLHNLLAIKEFAPLVDYFVVGNWIRVSVDDEVYKLRLVDYEIDFEDLDNIPVSFSDVTTTANGYTDIENILNSAKSMSSSYTSTQRQADKGNQSKQQLQHWVEDGLDLTNVKLKSDSVDQAQSWDENGMLFRRVIPETGEYEDTQIKIINSTIAFTDDNWESVKTAVGKFKYRDMLNGSVWRDGYGINAETLVGNVILGNQLGIYNGDNSLRFNQNGLRISGNKNEIVFTPSSDSTSTTSVMTISKITGNTSSQIFGFNSDGDLSLTGTVYAGSGQVGGWTIAPTNLSHQFSERKTRMVDSIIGYVTVNTLDENGDPIFEDVETTVTDYEIVLDAEGNIVYETDPNTGDVIVDENGDPVPKTIETITTTIIPTPVTHQEPVIVQVEEEYDDPISVYTTLKTTGDISIAVGVTALDANNEPDATTGKIKLFSNGVSQSIRNVIYRESLEPQIVFKRDRDNNTYAQSKIYMQDSDNGDIAFAFQSNTSNDYTYSVFMNQDGIYPYYNGGSYLGSTNYRWASLYAEYINATGTAKIGNLLQMTDTKNKTQNVISLYPYNKGINNGNSQLVIQASGNTYIGSGESAHNLYSIFNNNYGNAEYMYVSSDSNVYIYTNCQTVGNRRGFQFTNGGHFSPFNNTDAYLGLSGYKWKSVYATNGTIQTSDRKVKKDIQSIQHYKELVMNTLPIEFRFTYDGSDRLHYGVISQQFKEAMQIAGIDNCGAFCCDVSPEGVALGYTRETAPEEYLLYGMRYEELIAPILALVREHENTIQELKNEISLLKSN